jgi:putative ABC transport system ATP-binding protein
MIKLTGVTRSYAPGGVCALDGVTVEFASHEFVSIAGPSGCGKSTLLHLLGGLDRPDAGEIVVDGVPIHRASESELTSYRRRRVGIVFQFFNLLPAMTALENVELPLLLQGADRKTMRTRARELLDLVGLAHRASHFPHQLSGGEMQRAAIARALIHQPAIVLADEPTGNLDSANAARVMDALAKIASQKMATLLVVTHSESVAELASRRIHMLDGRILHG